MLAELEEMEQEELESDLLEVGEPAHQLAMDDPIDELPEVRKYSHSHSHLHSHPHTPHTTHTATAAPRAKKVVQEEDDDLKELAAWAS